MDCFAVAAPPDVHWAWTVLSLLSVPALVALNGFFVAAEFALVGVRKTRVEEMVRQGVPRAGAVREAVGHLDRYIAATQLGITLASIALGWLGEPALSRVVEPVLAIGLPAEWAGPMAHTVAVAIAFGLITFLHVVFGELIPKTLALQSPDRTSLWVAAPLVVFARLARPAIAAMNGVGNAILRRTGHEPAGGEAMLHSVEELGLLIEQTEEAGVLSHQQAEFVRKVFTLSGKRVGDCLVPRERVAGLALGTRPDQVLEIVRRGAHTRMPVYAGDLDNVVGVVNTKDLFYLFSLKGIVVLEDALYPPLFLKPEDNVADALELFRRERRPLAVVRDAAGKTVGLITMEDVLEQIVGEMEDEHDRPTPKLRVRPRLPLRLYGSPPPM
ncbi:hemolysin family protein [Limnoglobus roseus]|uniref:HlyC/CorC family transporter n=1 Tax=Limnoglobus roseus TaxID=2598579 RepID=A0A5C1AL01_9BACT|nr:hemolysin family protein [Limnoglobus roseus]QEL19620.1 HlyC/CorC family transporter [Limnoglobus roseus]